MSQNIKITVSDCQLLSESHTLPSRYDKNTIKKVKSSNCGAIETKQKIKSDHKVLNARLTKYKNTIKNFECACNNLKTSFESIKHFQTDSLANNNDLKFEELDTTVKNIIEKIFGINYPKSTTSLKKDHQQYISNLNTPVNSLFNNSTNFEHTKLLLAIKEAYEYVSTVFNINMKYHFWFEMITRRNEFNDLDDVQEYLIQNNIFDKEQATEQFDFNNFYSNLHGKLINIINEYGEVHKPKTVNDKIVIKEDELKDMELKMDMKIKNLIAENEKLKVTESEHCKQIKILLEELAFRNKKLINAKGFYDLLTKEKKDLISIINKTEVKEEGFHSLQKRVREEQEKNKHLRTVIDEYERKIVSGLF